MTHRCRFLAVLGLLGAVLGLLRGQDSLTVLSLSLLIWMYCAWCVFHLRCSLLLPHLRSQRCLNGQTASKATLWSGRTARVVVNLRSAKGRLPAWIVVRDWLPESLSVVEGQLEHSTCRPQSQLELSYVCRVLSAGDVRFPGLQLQFLDPGGLFIAVHFLPECLQVRSLPTYAQSAESRPTIKRINSLPQHGIHRLQRAGLGSELLELREYQAGDPPKSIAWKVSARRGKLMTRQYESEVPVRITLLIDGGQGVRYGGFGQRPIDRINYVAASIARAAVAAGDMVGLILVDELQLKRHKPAAGDRAFYQVLDALADFTAQPPQINPRFSLALLKTAISVCRRRYPDLMLDRFNRTAFDWFPILPTRRRWWYARRRVAHVLGQRQNLTPAQVCELYYDDDALAVAIQNLLSDNGLAMMPPLVRAESGRADEVSHSASRLGTALTECVARARDNEVFVLLADWIARPSDFEHVLSRAKVAIARHHRVVFLGITPEPSGASSAKQSRARDPRPLSAAAIERWILREAQQLHQRQVQQETLRQVRRIGAAMAYIEDPQATGLVLAEAELAGSGRTLSRNLS